MFLKIRNIGFCIAVLLFFSTMRLWSQNVEAYAKMDSTSILIGDQIKLELGITVPESFAVSLPFFIDTITTNIEIINKESIDTSTVEDGLLMKQLYTITSFDSGYFELPDFEFMFHHMEDTVLYRTNTNTLFLMVNTPIVDTSQAFKIIKGPIGEPYTFAEIAPWVILGLIVVGLIIFLIWFIRKKRAKQPVFSRKQKPQLPPHLLAIEKLEKLRLAKIWQQGKVKLYYTELTDIIREYFDGRFDIDAMEMTSDEILMALSGKEINQEAVYKIKSVLELADLVKFAKAQTTPLENDLGLSHCIDVVNETRPVIVTQPEQIEKARPETIKENI